MSDRLDCGCPANGHGHAPWCVRNASERAATSPAFASHQGSTTPASLGAATPPDDDPANVYYLPPGEQKAFLAGEIAALDAVSTGEAEAQGCWGFDCETAAAIEKALIEQGIRKHPDEGSYSPDEWARNVIAEVQRAGDEELTLARHRADAVEQEPDYEFAHQAFQRVTAYWPPEWVNDSAMFCKMLDAVMAAALRASDPRGSA